MVDATRPHVVPKKPERQSHENVPSSKLMHWPPFSQGSKSHGKISTVVVVVDADVDVVTVVVDVVETVVGQFDGQPQVKILFALWPHTGVLLSHSWQVMVDATRPHVFP